MSTLRQKGWNVLVYLTASCECAAESPVTAQGRLKWRSEIQNILTSYLICADHKQAYKSWPELSKQTDIWVYLRLTVQLTQRWYLYYFMDLSTSLSSLLFLKKMTDSSDGESYNEEVICMSEMFPELRSAVAPGCPEGILALWCPTRLLFALVGGKNKTRAGPGVVWSNNTETLLVFEFHGRFLAVIFWSIPLKSQYDHTGCHTFQREIQNKQVLH